MTCPLACQELFFFFFKGNVLIDKNSTTIALFYLFFVIEPKAIWAGHPISSPFMPLLRLKSILITSSMEKKRR